MDFAKAFSAFKMAAEAVEKLAPVAAALGGPTVAHVADMAANGAAIGRNIATRVEEGALVASETDQAALKKHIDGLAAINDDLANKVAES